MKCVVIGLIRVDSVRLRLVAVESDKGEFLSRKTGQFYGKEWYVNIPYSLYLTRVDFNNTDSGRNKFLSQGICKGADGSFRGTVDTAARVCFAASNASNVDDVSSAALTPLLENRENRLGHADQAINIGIEHGVNILGINLRSLGDTLDKTTTKRQYELRNIQENGRTNALLTKTSMSLNSSGKLGTKSFTSCGLLTSIFTGRTLTPSPTSSLISWAI